MSTNGLGEPDEVTRVVLADEGSDGVVELLGPSEGESIYDAIELVLNGRNFSTFDAALAAARLWRNHVTVAFAHYLVGIKIGSDSDPTEKQTSGFGSAYYPNPERRVREEPGLFVCEDGRSGGLTVQMLADARVLQGLDGLVNYAMRWITQRSYQITDQQSLAYALVHASYFEDNPETSYILLATVIEALLPPRDECPRDIAGVIDTLKETLDGMSDIDEELRQDVAEALEDDKFDPIGRRGRQLVGCLGTERFADKKPKDYFMHCYDIRSKLVHGNVERLTAAELTSELRDLRRFVLALLGVQVFGERMPERWTPETVPWPDTDGS
ncbi:hypothetical protein MTER_25360 [Mycolicibacter terrae]|uniref:Apea-like HEPN domain-containing protein n=2 Tax=Mycolicibacter terrae TaxID=1788 RepID=A0AAD1MIG0_9MYCO|nr:hypothetical protein MTER_25360 [Mycolicibacter terrae]